MSDIPPAPSAALLSFERMLASGKDGALLRYSLGNEYLKVKSVPEAMTHLARAVELDPRYTAAWKLLARSQEMAELHEAALASYRRGIEVAREKGDRQAEKEMTVFAKRLRK